MRLLWLAAGFLPYVALAGYDGWLHEKSRVVPRVEQLLHAGLALALVVFVVLVVCAQVTAALMALGIFGLLLAADELGYHAALAPRERRIHWLADAALAGFVVFWLRVDGVFG